MENEDEIGYVIHCKELTNSFLNPNNAFVKEIKFAKIFQYKEMANEKVKVLKEQNISFRINNTLVVKPVRVTLIPDA